MRKLKALGTIGTTGLLVTGMLFGTAQASSAATCKAGTAVPTNSFPGTVAVATNFESGSLDPFIPTVSGTGTAAVTSRWRRQGRARPNFTSPPTPVRWQTSPALRSLPETKTVYADGWFNITKAGVAGNDVPYFRVFSGSTRVADVYRYNSNGQLWLRVTAPNGTFVYTKLISGTSASAPGTGSRCESPATAQSRPSRSGLTEC